MPISPHPTSRTKRPRNVGFSATAMFKFYKFTSNLIDLPDLGAVDHSMVYVIAVTFRIFDGSRVKTIEQINAIHIRRYGVAITHFCSAN